MDDNFTQKYLIGDIVDSMIIEEEPSVLTLDFLKAFARTYYVEPLLPEKMNEVCVN